MKTNRPFALLLLLTFFVLSALQAQQPIDLPKRFDYGKMWTFEHPPKAWFKEAYGYDLNDQWFDQSRKSALRFANWCSASFVSPDGLIMTNHHCSRGVVGALMQGEENFDETGFYAPTRAEERRKDDLFVEQLIQVADITSEVEAGLAGIEGDEARATKTKEIMDSIKVKYSEMPDWKGLRLQVVTYYSGGKYSLYGYKRYDDIRLVMIPELAPAYFGGDYDNFTYPRYNLDVTFWRAYDEDGNPVNTSANYFPYNPDGIKEGTPVFVIGNPGRTERYRTFAQLLWDRDYRYPITLTFLQNRYDLMAKEYAVHPSHALQERMFGLSNSIKAISGIVKGLHDPHLMARKKNMEDDIIQNTPEEQQHLWTDIAKEYKMLEPYSAAIQLLGDNPLKGSAVHLGYLLQRYDEAMHAPQPDSSTLAGLKTNILEVASTLNAPQEKDKLEVFLSEIKQFDHPKNPVAQKLLKGRTPGEAAASLLKTTAFADSTKAAAMMALSPKEWNSKAVDPMVAFGRVVAPAYKKALNMFQHSSARRRALEAKVANAVFKVKGEDLPPDATFTLRIADGVVKSYDYNGTKAPYKTTYFGMYNRHYAFDGKAPWNIAEKWKNPSMDLLKSPLDFISTNDIIGGNSGSPIINVHHEAVGLIFDGNIESLPGNFIFDDTSNRTVSVHAGGIIAALKYVYHADPLVSELLQHYNATHKK